MKCLACNQRASGAVINPVTKERNWYCQRHLHRVRSNRIRAQNKILVDVEEDKQ